MLQMHVWIDSEFYRVTVYHRNFVQLTVIPNMYITALNCQVEIGRFGTMFLLFDKLKILIVQS